VTGTLSYIAYVNNNLNNEYYWFSWLTVVICAFIAFVTCMINMMTYIFKLYTGYYRPASIPEIISILILTLAYIFMQVGFFVNMTMFKDKLNQTSYVLLFINVITGFVYQGLSFLFMIGSLIIHVCAKVHIYQVNDNNDLEANKENIDEFKEIEIKPVIDIADGINIPQK
jgi:hypothetical protein